MIEWLSTLADLERRHLPAILVTVTSVAGSAPRAPGARMIVTGRELHGSIGGGRLEHEAAQVARALLATDVAATVRRVTLGPQLGQCCGGVVWLLFERLQDVAWHPAVARHIEAARVCIIATVLDPGQACHPRLGAKLIITNSGTPDGWGEPALEADVIHAAQRLLGSGQGAVTIEIGGRTIFLDSVIPEPPILVFGAGHVGRALVSILSVLPGPVRWFDSRADAFPPVIADHVTAEVSDAPEHDVAGAPPQSFFVVMTHSHQLDLAISERILRRGDFAYFGLIGSAAKRQRFERRLQLRGIGADALARMRCPIGIPGIRGKHPGEIALAVAADLHQARSRGATALATAVGEESALRRRQRPAAPAS